MAGMENQGEMIGFGVKRLGFPDHFESWFSAVRKPIDRSKSLRTNVLLNSTKVRNTEFLFFSVGVTWSEGVRF